MSSSPQTANAVNCRETWPAVLRETTVEVFSTMVGATVTTPDKSGVPVVEQVTGMVGIAGPLSATVSLRCSLQSATTIASQMLGVPLEEAAAQKCDAIGEICNIVAGYFKAKVGLGDLCMLSVPTVLAGTDYQIRTRDGDVRIELPVLHEGAPVWIALDIRP
jgi:chemotaxis protein CheX